MSVSRIVLTAGFLLTSGLTMPSTAEACSCMQPSAVRSTSDSDNVFRGRVIKKKTFGTDRYFKFKVKRTYKGCYEAGDIVYLRTAVSSATCGQNLNSGGRYLITGDNSSNPAGDPIVTFNMCGYNVLFNTTTSAERDYLNSRYVDCPGAYQGCADGGPMVSCFIDPCTTGQVCTTGTCTANYCGGCNAEFYDASGNATCDTEWTVSPP